MYYIVEMVRKQKVLKKWEANEERRKRRNEQMREKLGQEEQIDGPDKQGQYGQLGPEQMESNLWKTDENRNLNPSSDLLGEQLRGHELQTHIGPLDNQILQVQMEGEEDSKGKGKGEMELYGEQYNKEKWELEIQEGKRQELERQELGRQEVQGEGKVNEKGKVVERKIAVEMKPVGRLNISAMLQDNSKVVGREEEMKKIHQFMASPFQPILYICGTPGTGKTLSLTHALQAYRPSPIVFLNCLKTSESSLVGSIAQVDPSPVAIVLDEFDMVGKKREKLTEILGEYPLAKVLLICNDNKRAVELDTFPIGFTDLFFMPYKAQEVREIALTKLEGGDVRIPREILEMGVRMAVGKSGDFRQFQKYMLNWVALSQLHPPSLLSPPSLLFPPSPLSSVSPISGLRPHKYLASLIQHSSPLLNTLLLSLVTLVEEWSLGQRRGCVCGKVSMQGLRKKMKVQISGGEVEHYVGEWQEMGLVVLHEDCCSVHHVRVQRVDVRFDLDEAKTELNSYFYIH